MDPQQNTENQEKNKQDIKKRYKALISKWKNLSSENNAYFRLTPILLILIALPLIVLLSLQQQSFRQKAATLPDCNSRLTCGACTSGTSSCSYGNGTESCSYTQSLDGSSCNTVTFAQVFCHINNCSSGTTCSNQQCVSTNTPTATPTPTITPTPVANRPFPVPVTTQTISFPSTIDTTGATEVSQALNNFIATVPDGSIISFKSGGTYLLKQGIQIANRKNLIFEGNNSTLKIISSALATDQLASEFVLGHQYGGSWANGNSNITIRNFTLIGNDPTPGTFTSGQEGQANLEITGTNNVEISNVTGSAAPGDFAFFEGVNGAWLHNSHAISAGRNGVSVISGTNVTAENSAFDKSGYLVFDDEPNDSTEASTNIIFRNNTATSWGAEFAAVEGSHTGAPINGVTIDGNTITSGALLTVVDNGGTARMKNIIFTNNVSKVTGAGPILIFAHVDGLTVTGNTQPLSGGSLTSISDSTGVNITNNH